MKVGFQALKLINYVVKMRVLIAGGSGLIGRALQMSLQDKGHIVHCLERKQGAQFFWDPDARYLPQEHLVGHDVIINLSGQPILSGLWTKSQKEKIAQSRIQATKLLVDTINALKVKPKLFISASATGFYGDTHDEEVTEESPKGKGFLADVCEAWENEAKKVQGVRTCCFRIGLVLSSKGGALEKMLPIFRLGLGGRLGSGKQWMSWIAIDDLVNAFDFAMMHDIEGAVNIVSPVPVTNAMFTKALGAVLKRPTWFTVPEWLLKGLLGEFAEETVLCSQKVVPQVLMQAGFQFQYKDLSQALSSQIKLLP